MASRLALIRLTVPLGTVGAVLAPDDGDDSGRRFGWLN